MELDVNEDLVMAQWGTFKAELGVVFEPEYREEELSSSDAVEVALYIQEQIRLEEEEERALAIYEQNVAFEMEELANALETWNISGNAGS